MSLFTRPAPGAISSSERYRRIRMVLIYTLAANLAVALGKGAVGMSAGSIAMVADAFHSLMDGSSNVIGLVGITLAARPRDEDHTYGHAKFETFASIGVVVLMLVTALQIGRSVYERLGSGATQPPEAGALPFAMMAVTIAVNLTVSFYERRRGRQLNSGFLVADSRHTLSDVYVSFSVIASLVAVRLGLGWLDAVVGGLIAMVIAWSALKIMKEASSVLLDRAVIDPALVERVIMGAPGVRSCHKIRTRGSEAGYWIDLHIQVDPEMTTREAHDIATGVERKLKDEFGEETDTVVHIEPE